MTRLSLSQTCLMDVSGELGQKAQAQLHEHIAQFPAALLEYELTRGKYELLRSMPTLADQFDETECKKIADSIKMGIHRTLRQQEREEIARKRWKIIYRCMAGVSGMAACLVILASVWLVQKGMQAEQRKLRDAESTMQEIADVNAVSPANSDYSSVASDIRTIEQSRGPSIASSVGNMDMIKLLDALDAPPRNFRTGHDPGSM